MEYTASLARLVLIPDFADPSKQQRHPHRLHVHQGGLHRPAESCRAAISIEFGQVPGEEINQEWVPLRNPERPRQPLRCAVRFSAIFNLEFYRNLNLGFWIGNWSFYGLKFNFN